MLKHDFHSFLESLKTEGRLLALNHIYTQLEANPKLDLYYYRPKVEDLFREGLHSSPANYLDLLALPALSKDLSEWNATSLHLILEKSLELGRTNELLKVLKICPEKLSTIKIIDLLKRMLILDKTTLADEFLDVMIDNKLHGKSKQVLIVRLSGDLHPDESLGNQEQTGPRNPEQTKKQNQDRRLPRNFHQVSGRQLELRGNRLQC